MAQLTIRAGDVPAGHADFILGTLLLLPPASLFGSREALRPSAIRFLHIDSEEVVKHWAGAAGMGALGAMALGPVDVLAALLGGWDCKVTFLVRLHDGRDFLATSSRKTYDALLAATT